MYTEGQFPNLKDYTPEQINAAIDDVATKSKEVKSDFATHILWVLKGRKTVVEDMSPYRVIWDRLFKDLLGYPPTGTGEELDEFLDRTWNERYGTKET